MNNVPKELQWRGETIYFKQAVELIASDEKPYTRYDYGFRDETKAYFYDFGRGIDWEAEQAGNIAPLNPDTPKVYVRKERELAMTKGAIYKRQWKERRRLGIEPRLQLKAKPKLQETPPEAKPMRDTTTYDEFIAWLDNPDKSAP